MQDSRSESPPLRRPRPQPATYETTSSPEPLRKPPRRSDDWMTPNWLCQLVRLFFQRCGFRIGIDLDPCSHKKSARKVQARLKYSLQEDGLNRDWVAETVFMNPPFSNIANWVNKLERAIEQNKVKLGLALLPSNRINCEWYIQLIQKYAHAHLLEHVAFGSADEDTRTTKPADFASVLVLLVSPQFACERDQCWQILADVFKTKAIVMAPVTLISGYTPNQSSEM